MRETGREMRSGIRAIIGASKTELYPRDGEGTNFSGDLVPKCRKSIFGFSLGLSHENREGRTCPTIKNATDLMGLR
jgi:hypothetical protein